MIVFRVIQAIPGGVLPVVTLTILYRIVPKERIGAAMGMYGLGIIVAPAVGPTLGGYLVEYVDWRLIFFINVPVGIVGAVAALVVLPALPRRPARAASTWWGFLAIATGLFTLLLALTEGQDWGWTSYKVLILLTVGVLSLALFVVIELEVDHPLLDVRVFRYWPFTNSLLLISVLSVGLFTVLFYVPLFLQQSQGLGAFEAGLLLLPQALVMAVCMPVAGRVYDRFGPRWPAVIGLSIVAWGTYELHVLTLETTHAHLVWLLVPARGRHGHRHDADHDRRHRRGAARAGQPGERVQQRRAAHLRRARPGRADRAGGPDAGPARRGPGRRWSRPARTMPVLGLRARPASSRGCTRSTSRPRPRCSSRRWTGCSSSPPSSPRWGSGSPSSCAPARHPRRPARASTWTWASSVCADARGRCGSCRSRRRRLGWHGALAERARGFHTIIAASSTVTIGRHRA